MIIKSASLDIVIGPTSSLPPASLPEIAFAGRSNVGKSSLINALMCRKSLARTSSQPGKTQTINYYKINDAFYYVDLPGYGYAKASHTAQEKWAKMIENYLRKSSRLRTVFLLLDIRHEPKVSDRQMYEWIIEHGFTPVLIATKADKISKNAIPKNLKIIREVLNVPKGTTIIPFSAETKAGREEIWAMVEQFLTDPADSEQL